MAQCTPVMGNRVTMPHYSEDVAQDVMDRPSSGDNGNHLSKAERWIKTGCAFGTFIGWVSI